MLRPALRPIVACLVVFAGCSSSGSGESPRAEEVVGTPTAAAEGKPPKGPNVVVFMTDDQNPGDLVAMPRVERLLVDRGVTFTDSFVNYPLCCPSRATQQTGQYAHNHGVLANHLPDGGYPRLESANTLPVWLSDAGYRTAYIGKYMNGIGFDAAPGWQTWQTKGGESEYRYFDYTLNDNGRLVDYRDRPRDYIDTVINREAVDYIGKRGRERRPFFLMLGYLAPHVREGPDRGCGPEPAPRDRGAFDNERIVPSPSFNERNVADKPTDVEDLSPLTRDARRRIVARHRCRLESLLDVDRGVGRVVGALKRTGSLRDTFLIYTSDNGLMQGEHRIQGGKEQPYEEAIRVPLIFRGPGIPRGHTARTMAVNADLAPTITALTGARPGLAMDGESLLPYARHPPRVRDRDLLIQAKRFTGLRTRRYMYVERDTGERELYDLERDPHELRNVTHDVRYAGVEGMLASRLAELRDCAGAECRR